ncbi:MAG TPA: sugar phosphate isomerase/epimerase family protein [Casimicrobiaceae bacterium]|nr:sugar phosphate isomerase/epimerase family protein [Casimicrobiaceae bacterium]
MKIGWYAPGGMEMAPLLKDIGYDYIELGLAPLNIEDKTSMRASIRKAAGCPLPTLVWNNFYPRDIRIVDPGVDETRLKRYLTLVAEFLHAVKAEVIVMGSAWSRNLSEGADPARAEVQLVRVLHWAADAFAGCGATIALEAQNHLECNFIRRVGEAVAIAKKVNRAEIRAMADLYHMQMENESLELLRDVGPWLAHVQVADTDRRNPGTGSYPFERFIQCLSDGGYTANLSVECMTEIPEPEIRRSLHFLRQIAVTH